MVILGELSSAIWCEQNMVVYGHNHSHIPNWVILRNAESRLEVMNASSSSTKKGR